ncbi:MAG: hypothetical protein IT289_12255 [Oligoflexia bacterium]|nr:hypothetical protein [Oligoflexia bacterium]
MKTTLTILFTTLCLLSLHANAANQSILVECRGERLEFQLIKVEDTQFEAQILETGNSKPVFESLAMNNCRLSQGTMAFNCQANSTDAVIGFKVDRHLIDELGREFTQTFYEIRFFDIDSEVVFQFSNCQKL